MASRQSGQGNAIHAKAGAVVAWQQHKDYKHPAVQKFDKAISFMEKYTADQQRITWAEVIELEAKKKAK